MFNYLVSKTVGGNQFIGNCKLEFLQTKCCWTLIENVFQSFNCCFFILILLEKTILFSHPSLSKVDYNQSSALSIILWLFGEVLTSHYRWSFIISISAVFFHVAWGMSNRWTPSFANKRMWIRQREESNYSNSLQLDDVLVVRRYCMYLIMDIYVSCLC